MAEFKAPAPEDIAAARKKIETAIIDGMNEAGTSGKKLLIVAGENHFSHDSVLLESIALDIAEKHGVKNFAVELNSEAMDILKFLPLRLPAMPFSQIMMPLGQEVLQMNPVLMELPSIRPDKQSILAAVSDEGIVEREKYMFNKISEIKDHTIAFTGILHVPGFAESKQLQKDYVIVALDLDNADTRANTTPLERERSNYLLHSKNIEAVTLQGDAREMMPWDIVSAGIGKEKTGLLQNALMKQGLLSPDENLDNGLKALNELLAKEPANAQYLNTRAEIYAQRGMYDKAYEDYRLAKTYNPAYQGQYMLFMDNIPGSVRQRLEENLTPNFAMAIIGIPGSPRRYNELVQHGLIPPDLDQKNPALHEHLWNGGVSDYVAAGKASFKELEEMGKSNPEVLNALRHYNFKQGIMNGFITVQQVDKLSEEQLGKLKSGPSGIKLREAVEGFIGKELSPPMPEKTPVPFTPLRPLAPAA